MKENGPTTSGEYVDRGPRIESAKFSEPSFVRETVRQGKDRPRPLTLVETELVARNRRKARQDLAAMERWYRQQVKEPLTGPDLAAARGGAEDRILHGVALGGDFWAPRIW